jgi:Selenoprotein, putative
MPLNEIAPANESNLTRIRRAAGAVWQWLRGFTGDTAYEGYLRHASECPGKQLTAEEFYLDDIERKFTRPNRCC